MLVWAWLDVYEDPVTGNTQKQGKFWQRVIDYFHTGMKKGNYRNTSQTNSKWTDLNLKIGLFNEIYNMLKSEYHSGWSEAEYIETAHIRYHEQKNGAGFTHEAAWKVVKDLPKWMTIPLMKQPRPSKRSKTSSSHAEMTSSDARCRFDLHDDEEEEFNMQMNEPQRPMGRDKTKKVAGSSGMSFAATEKDEKISILMTAVAELRVESDKV